MTRQEISRRSARKTPYYRDFKGGADKGERYVVKYRDGMGTERTFGFADDEKGVAKLKERLSHNPAWKFTRAVDREKLKTAEVVKLEVAGG